MTIRRLLLFSAATFAFAQPRSGVDPRPSAADYPAHTGNDAVSLGAVFLGSTDQRTILGEDWSGSYLIVEVALYPEPGHPLTVTPRDFMLRAGTERVAPVDAETMVPYPRTSNPPSIDPNSKVHVRTVDTIGVASGPNGRKTVYTDSQVQVAVGDTPYPTQPPPPPRDPKFERRHALEEKELPDAKTANSIAGYLYFPKPKHLAKDAAFELDYYGDPDQLKLPLERKR